jgi:hypothetical protein
MRTSALLAAGLALTATAVTTTAAAAPGTGAVSLRHSTTDTLNWAGYVDIPKQGKVSVAAGDFTVPTVQSDLPPGISSTWVGIGGATGNDLIQAGVGENSPPTLLTGPTYFAWYEMLPDSETPLDGCQPKTDCPVAAGDQMHVSIRNVGANKWAIVVNDVGKWSWSKTVSYVSSQSSAEWIAEAVALAGVPTIYGHLSTVRFDHGVYALAGHRRTVIGAGNPDLDTMTMLGFAPREATPSALDAQRDGFNVCAYSSTCPAPR